MFARVEINVAEFPTKTAKEEEEEADEIVPEIFFKSGCASASKMSFFAGKTYFGEGGITSKLASQ